MAFHLKVFFNLEKIPTELSLRELVCEKYKCVLQIIQMRTGAHVTLCGQGSGFVDPVLMRESPEPMHLRIEHTDPALLTKAQEMAMELAKSIRLECDRFTLLQQEWKQVGIPATQSQPPAYQQTGNLPSGQPLYSSGERSSREDSSRASLSKASSYSGGSQREEAGKRFKQNEEPKAMKYSRKESHWEESLYKRRSQHEETDKKRLPNKEPEARRSSTRESYRERSSYKHSSRREETRKRLSEEPKDKVSSRREHYEAGSLNERSSRFEESSTTLRLNQESEPRRSSQRESNGWDTKRIQSSHDPRSKLVQLSCGTSQSSSALRTQTPSILSMQQSRPDALHQLQNEIQAQLSVVHVNNDSESQRQPELNVTRGLEQVDLGVGAMQIEALSRLTSTQWKAVQSSAHLQQQPTSQRIPQLDDVSLTPTSAAQCCSLQSNLGPVTIKLCEKTEDSLYAAIANQLFGPFRSLKEQSLCASILHRRAVDYVKKNKELYSDEVQSFYIETHRTHDMDPEMIFENGCFDLLRSSNALSWKGQHILLKSIVLMFSKSVCIYEEVKTVGDVITLKRLFILDKPLVTPLDDSCETPISVLRRNSFKNHYDVLLFLKSKESVQKDVRKNSITLPTTIAKPEGLKYLKLRISTWKVGICLEQNVYEAIDSFLANHNLSFVCIQVKTLNDYSQIETTNYKWCFGGNFDGNNRLAFLVRKNQLHINCFNDHTRGIISAEVVLNDKTFCFVGCYCLHFDLDAYDYYQKLNQIISSFPPSSNLFVLGEFPSHIKFSIFPRSEAHLIGPSFVDSKLPSNKDAALLIDLAIKHQLFFISTWPTKCSATFRLSKCPKSKQKLSQTGHILLRQCQTLECVSNIRSWNKTFSQHAVVTCLIRLQLSN